MESLAMVIFVAVLAAVVAARPSPPCPPIDAQPHCTAAPHRRGITCHRIADPLPLLPLMSVRRERPLGEDGEEEPGLGVRERRWAGEEGVGGRKAEVRPELVRSITFCAYPDDVIDLGPIIKEFPELRRLTVAPGGMVSQVVGFDLEDEAGASSSSSSSEETGGAKGLEGNGGEAAGGGGEGGAQEGEEELWAALLRLSASSLSRGNVSAIMGPMEADEEERLMRLLRRRRLRSLDLSGNRLRNLEAGRWIRRVHKIYLAGNPWNCSNGGLRWLVADRDRTLPSRLGRRIADRDKLMCSDDSYPGKPLFPVMALIKHLHDQCPDSHPWHCNCSMTNVVWHSGGDLGMGWASGGGSTTGGGVVGKGKRPDWLVPVIMVDCSHRNLSRLPSRLPDNTTSLYVKGNRISDLRPLVTNEDYRDVKDIYLDNNDVTSVDVLEGSHWLMHFRVFSLKSNQISRLPVYALDAALERNSNAWGLFLAGNPWDCACAWAPQLRDFLAKYGSTVARDVGDVRCAFAEGDDLSLEPVVDLSRREVCMEGGDWRGDWGDGYWTDGTIEPLDVANIVLLLLLIFVLSKLAFDCFIYRRTGRLPWIVTKMP
ncbi:protein singed wings 2 [Hetaerina americana]|uniref:protein singed wings 2 n=1 Tax=Hetaerina americana TaxID=62018 RepID=UPI003A7F3922